MEVNVKLIDATAKDSDDLVNSFDDISKCVEHISDVNAIVATASEEQSSVTFDISKQLEDVNCQIQDNLKAMEVIAISSQDVMDISNDLQKEFDFFKVSL